MLLRRVIQGWVSRRDESLLSPDAGGQRTMWPAGPRIYTCLWCCPTVPGWQDADRNLGGASWPAHGLCSESTTEDSPGRVHSEKVLVHFSCCPPFTGPQSVRSTDSWNIMYWLCLSSGHFLKMTVEDKIFAEDTVSPEDMSLLNTPSLLRTLFLLRTLSQLRTMSLLRC